jgi:hypothetical protein
MKYRFLPGEVTCIGPTRSKWINSLTLLALLRPLRKDLRAILPCKHPVGNCPNSTLLGYTDADWDGELEKRKSTTGVLFLFNGGPVSYGSRRQRATALSTRELGNILVTHIRGKEQPADIFTKSLPRTMFENYRELIGVRHITED